MKNWKALCFGFFLHSKSLSYKWVNEGSLHFAPTLNSVYNFFFAQYLEECIDYSICTLLLNISILTCFDSCSGGWGAVTISLMIQFHFKVCTVNHQNVKTVLDCRHLALQCECLVELNFITFLRYKTASGTAKDRLHSYP